MSREPADLRSLINTRLALLGNPVFERGSAQWQANDEEMWNEVLTRLSNLRREKATFFDRYDYDWAFYRTAYNSVHEALMQWRLLNVITDIDADHPNISRCKNIVVRVVPTSSVRISMRYVDDYRLVIFTSGYFQALKGFARLWFRGVSLGFAISKTDAVECAGLTKNYTLAIARHEEDLAKSATDYIFTLTALSMNEIPTMNQGSIFDEDVVKYQDFGLQFSSLSLAIDGFVLFHELAHILEGDELLTCRSREIEMAADRGAFSLSIIDAARRKDNNVLTMGAPFFFYVEILRAYLDILLEARRSNGGIGEESFVTVKELMARFAAFESQCEKTFGVVGGIHNAFLGWKSAFGIVYHTARWALFRLALKKEYERISLRDYILEQYADNHSE